MAQAQEQDDTRTLIFAHLRRGEVLLDQEAPREAENDFNAGLALADTSGLREFELDLLLGLAQAREAQQDLAEARRLFRRVIDAELPGMSVAEVKRARREAEAALLRVMLADEGRTGPAPWLWTAMLLLLSLSAYLLYSQRRSAAALRAVPNFLPPWTPKDSFPFDDENILLAQRLDYIDRVLREFPAVLEVIEDVMRKKQLAQGLTCNTDLFHCVAALEEKDTGRIFENDPANTLGRYLRQEFKIRHIPWPQTPTAWQRLLESEAYQELKSRHHETKLQ